MVLLASHAKYLSDVLSRLNLGELVVMHKHASSRHKWEFEGRCWIIVISVFLTSVFGTLFKHYKIRNYFLKS